MKAIIPVAGVGTRLRPHTYTRPKPLIPVAGKPMISFIIDRLIEADIKDFVFVIGYLGSKIRHYIEQQYPHLNIEFVYQEERLGLGHAIWVARKAFEASEQILIVLGDTIFDTNLKVVFEQPYSCLSIKKVEDPREFGVVELDERGFIRKVVEKPKIPKSNMAIVGIYKIEEVQKFIAALTYIIENDVRTLEEYQLTDALMHMIDEGAAFTTHEVDNWFDCGKKDILLETNSMLLKQFKPSSEDSDVRESIIIPPVHIGKNCTIRHSIVGPNVTIGDDSSIHHSIIKNSIIGSFSEISEMVLERSVIGSDAAIKGPSQSLNIGDNTEIDFS